MKYRLLIAFSLFFSTCLFALDIPAGTYYFDNSKTKYSTVQFLYGKDNPKEYTIVDLTKIENNRWQLTIPTTIKNMYRYSFTHSSLPVGTFTDMSFTEKKDDISLNKGLYRTATTSASLIVGGIYVPETGNNWTQGQWRIEQLPSNTLPVFYLNTAGNAEIISKDTYINAQMYIDASGFSEYSSAGSKQNPINTEIRGRGNYTWTSFDKKPYRIKMNSSDRLLNMTKNKNYALLAHADDPTFLRNEVGFELSRRLGFAFTPKQEPVEFVKNGEYQGLYFLTEQIKISSERINLPEQKDYETNPLFITGAWLIEIDNYYESNQLSTQRVPRFTYKSPKELSSLQEAYLQTFLQKAEDAIYSINKEGTTWENYIDIDALVDFYIIQEIMGNTESFHGSCYFTKDRGDDSKIIFGPVWDFGNAYRHGNKFIYEDVTMFESHWISEIVKFSHFQEKLKRRWSMIRYNELATINDYINQFTDKIKNAVEVDYAQWPKYGSKNYNRDIKVAKDYVANRIAWLDTQWLILEDVDETKPTITHIYPNPTSGIVNIDSPDNVLEVKLYDLTGKLLRSYVSVENGINLDVSKGTYIITVATAKDTIKTKIIVL